ncbi:MAG: response regulator, partial [Clostridiales bacterium]|nr:response regulator [Clostridiales bacterium]
TIEDTGIGIRKEDQSKLFKSFVQIDSSLIKKYGGTGLGLAIVKSLVTMMDGEIGVESDLGVGSKFFFKIPFELDNTKGSKADGLDDEAGAQEIKKPEYKILLAEDDVINQFVITKFLDRLGCAVTTAENGVKAVGEFKKQDFDMILLDVQMPVMDGLEACSKIRKHEKSSGRRTPVIAISAFAMENDKVKCLEAGMDDFIAKPLSLGQLNDMIQKWIIK